MEKLPLSIQPRNYKDFEAKLNKISGFPDTDGPFTGIADVVRRIIRMKKTDDSRKMWMIADILELTYTNHMKSHPTDEFIIMNTEEYAKKVKRSRITIAHWAKAGKIPNAYCVGTGKNKKWVIIVKRRDITY